MSLRLRRPTAELLRIPGLWLHQRDAPSAPPAQAISSFDPGAGLLAGDRVTPWSDSVARCPFYPSPRYRSFAVSLSSDKARRLWKGYRHRFCRVGGGKQHPAPWPPVQRDGLRKRTPTAVASPMTAKRARWNKINASNSDDRQCGTRCSWRGKQRDEKTTTPFQ